MKIARLRNLEKVVEGILRKYELAREDDCYLILEVIRELYPEDAGRKFYEVMIQANKKGLDLEKIFKIKKKILETCEDLYGDTEIWKDVIGYEGLYEVSNFGRVRSCNRILKNTTNNIWQNFKGRMLKQDIGDRGYYCVRLCKNNKSKHLYVHRLVLETFIPNPENKEQVNHIDGNKRNNRVDNLEWCTVSENIQHAYDTGLNELRKKAVNQYDLNGNLIKRWNSMADIEKENKKYKANNISHCCRGKSKTSCGFIWKYAEQEEYREFAKEE